MIRLLLAILVVLPAAGQEIYDFLLKNGNVIDPANQRAGRFDVAVIGKKIAKVAPDIPASHARIVVEAGGYYITPGLIDINTHFGAEPGSLQPDHNCLRYGVTTAVDAGSANEQTFETFRTKVAARSKVRVLAFLSVKDPDAAAAVVRKYAPIIVGVKAGKAVEPAVKAAELSGANVLAESFSDRLRRGDIQTHMYSAGSPVDARKHGVLLDVGHGSNGFLFRVAVPAIRAGLLPDTISTGMDPESALLLRTNMTTVMSRFLSMGMSPAKVIEWSTVNPARAIHRPELGTLSEGSAADIAVFAIERGTFGYVDSGHAKLTGDRQIRCAMTVRDGAVVWDSDGLAAPDWIRMGPYTNFR